MSEKNKVETDIVKTDEIKETNDGNRPYVIHFNPPVSFEGMEYDRIDLSCLEDVTAMDMIAVSRKLSSIGNSDFMQENSMEYALNLAARAAGLPVEFFEQLKMSHAMKVKRCVAAFLYRVV
ncbi:MAG: phage tail assembly protein [Lachnospiraceae bacterium]|nr:phage tail assembly protein [Lachnospiraceae bacterium]